MDDKAKTQGESQVAGLQSLVSLSTDTQTRDALQDALSTLATKVQQGDTKGDKVPISEYAYDNIKKIVTNIQEAFKALDAKIEKEELKKEENLETPPPPPTEAAQQSRRA